MFICVHSQWIYEMFARVYGNACAKWYAGVDLSEWSDTSRSVKDVDFLMYDKIRWDHDQFKGTLPIRSGNVVAQWTPV